MILLRYGRHLNFGGLPLSYWAVVASRCFLFEITVFTAALGSQTDWQKWYAIFKVTELFSTTHFTQSAKVCRFHVLDSYVSSGFCWKTWTWRWMWFQIWLQLQVRHFNSTCMSLPVAYSHSIPLIKELTAVRLAVNIVNMFMWSVSGWVTRTVWDFNLQYWSALWSLNDSCIKCCFTLHTCTTSTAFHMLLMCTHHSVSLNGQTAFAFESYLKQWMCNSHHLYSLCV